MLRSAWLPLPRCVPSLCPLALQICSESGPLTVTLGRAVRSGCARLASCQPAAGTHGPEPDFAAIPALPPRATASSRPRAGSVHLRLAARLPEPWLSSHRKAGAGQGLSSQRAARPGGAALGVPARVSAPRRGAPCSCPPFSYRRAPARRSGGRAAASVSLPFSSDALCSRCRRVIITVCGYSLPRAARLRAAPLRSRALAAGRGRSARRSRSASGRRPTPRRAAARGAPDPARAVRREGTNGRRTSPLPSAPGGAPPPAPCAAAVGGAVAGPAARQRGDVRLRIIAD